MGISGVNYHRTGLRDENGSDTDGYHRNETPDFPSAFFRDKTSHLTLVNHLSIHCYRLEPEYTLSFLSTFCAAAAAVAVMSIR